MLKTVNMQERNEWVLESYSSLDECDPCKYRKQKPGQTCKLPQFWMHFPSLTRTTDKGWGPHRFKEFKHNFWLIIKLTTKICWLKGNYQKVMLKNKNKKKRTEQRHEQLATHYERNRLHRISPCKPLNKQSNHLQLWRKRNQNAEYIINNIQISTKIIICAKKKQTRKVWPIQWGKG